jgi:hypothetical protein
LDLGVPVSTYNSHERAGEPGARLYSIDEAKTYARRFSTDYIWLLTGDKPSASRQLSPEAHRAIELLAGLDPEDRDFVLGQLQRLTERLGKK